MEILFYHRILRVDYFCFWFTLYFATNLGQTVGRGSFRICTTPANEGES